MPLSAADAEKRLLEFRISDVKKESVAWTVLNHFSLPSSRYISSENQRVIGEAIPKLNFLTRGVALNKIGGPLRPTLEKALKSAPGLAFQHGLSRLPFRAPHDEEVGHANRGRVVSYVVYARETYDQPIEWYAEWCGFLNDYNFYGLDVLLAAEIDSGNESVLDILLQSLEGTHPIGIPSQVGIRALIRCERPEAWQAVEKVFLNAGRAEGLRQAIIECADELNPVVFQRFTRLIVEHNLLRFSSVIRAFITWFPSLIQEGKTASAEQLLMRMLEFFRDPQLEPNPTYADVYLRLWTEAFIDAEVALKRSRRLIESDDVDVRRAVAQIVAEIRLAAGEPLIKIILNDPDRRVSSSGIWFLSRLEHNSFSIVFELQILALARTWPEAKTDDVPWTRKQVWGIALSHASVENLPYYFENMHELSAEARGNLVRYLHHLKDPKFLKAMILKLAADSSSHVRVHAFAALAKSKITPEDALELETLLKRKAADLRTAVLTALSSQSPSEALESARRLSVSSDASQRKAGAELADELAKRGVKGAQEFATEECQPSERATAKDLFGLMNVAEITFAAKPKPVPGQTVYTPEAIQIIRDFDDYLHERKDDVVIAHNKFELNEIPIGNLTAGNLYPYGSISESIPFYDEVFEWYRDRLPNTIEEKDQFLRASLLADQAKEFENKIPPGLAQELSKYMHPIPRRLSAIQALLNKLCLRISFSPKVILDLMATVLSESAAGRYEYIRNYSYVVEHSWRMGDALELLGQRFLKLATNSGFFTSEDWSRAFQLYRYIDEPLGSAGREKTDQAYEETVRRYLEDRYWYNRDTASHRNTDVPDRLPVPLIVANYAFEAGNCTKSDLLDQVRFRLKDATEKEKSLGDATRAAVQELVDRIVDVEVQRGDLPGEATYLAKRVVGMIHLRNVLEILRTGAALSRNDYGEGRSPSLTRLLAFSRPGPGESPEICAAAFRELKPKPERLVELAMLAPHWAAAIEQALDWPHFESAVWWIHAHTKDEDWSVPQEIKDLWAGAISERTALTADQLQNGACDPAWFHRFRSGIGDPRWKLLDKNAKFASSGSGHARAQLFARAISGELRVEELAALIRQKRNQNQVRALGLIPLGADPDADVRTRYGLLQEFLAGSRQFGSLRQSSEKLAFEIGIENLAATAGYPDALRLTWAMEASEVQDLAQDGVTVTAGDVSVRLYFDDLGQPTIEASKGGKPLKEVPAATKKIPEIKTLVTRRTQLKKQLVRMRLALEQAMQRGDNFTADELRGLFDHPGLLPLLSNLVFVGESGQAGFPDERGVVAGETGSLKIAHPYDLLSRGDWPEWQSRVFREERVQPFKQVFRELYVLTESERNQTELTRFGGHQVRPAQMLGILGKRGWIARYEEGISKTFHALGITAWINTDYVAFSPADVEGATLKGLYFTSAKFGEPMPLSEVPPLVFTETVRDLDLVASVASMVGVDPEASESTVEMRQSVVEQTARLLNLDNVSFIPRHVVIQGKLAEYTVNLSSGTVHQRARGELVIIAVRQPQRGRLFLPFVDDDPRTAEIVSKTILLARDHEMKDPSILRQIVGG